MKHTFLIYVMAFVIVLMLALAGCGSKPAAQPTVDVNATIEVAVQKTIQAQPTPTLLPANTPSVTPTITPSPTSTPVPPTPIPTPDPRLFWDDFETGIRPEWEMRGNYGLVNGDFVVENEYFEGYLGDQSWDDYEVNMDLAFVTGFQMPLRIQDQDNYMLFEWFYENGCFFRWSKVIRGETIEIPASVVKFQGCCDWCTNYNLRVEILGDTYRTFLNGDQRLMFIDSTYTRGGLGLKHPRTGITLREFEVRELEQ